MGGVNKVILVGNLGQDPKANVGASGKAVARFGLAVTEKASGAERTEWFNIVAFDRVAEIASTYLSKGRQVYIEGRLQTRKYQDKNTGQERQQTEVIASTLQMLGQGGGRPKSKDDPFSDPFADDQPATGPSPLPTAPKGPEYQGTTPWDNV